MLRRFLPVAVLIALVLAACGNAASPTPTLTGREIITKGMEATANLKSFHLAATASGTLNVEQLGSSGLNLKGTTLEGDVDIAGKKAALHFLVPPLLNVEGDVVVADDAVYVKTTLTGPKWTREAAGGPGASPSSVPDPKTAIDELRAFLDKEGVQATKLDDASCGDRTCYQVELTIPAKLLDDAAGSAAPLPSGALGQDLVLNLKFDKEKLYLASASTSIDAQASGSLTLDVTLSNFDEATSISAPPSDQVDASGGGFSLP
ncbi:MAG TPA: hypothetical protein VFM74_00630 [Candidatus Limnocylindria bacterium]|nr:hypothetical protein [Candidatus Limnocylindria bacterium]